MAATRPTSRAMISLSPLYLSPAARDNHLQELSAGVDVGDPNSPIANDFDGQQRPVNTGFDIGADETGSCSVRVVGSGPSPPKILACCKRRLITPKRTT
ncbi:MAG: hypothetical protein IPL28_16205 [Chloroflexi bacterium]|nr:hypothetical protein [Chloroflexota bacterium]